MPSEQRSLLAAALLASPSAQASTTRARRARSGWLRARWDKDWSRSRSSEVKINGFRGRPVRIKASSTLDATRAELVHLFLGRETSSGGVASRIRSTLGSSHSAFRFGREPATGSIANVAIRFLSLSQSQSCFLDL